MTMPNWPWTLVAGKYEKARPPDHTGDIWELKRAATSVQSRAPAVMQPNSLKYAGTLYPAKSPSTPAYDASKVELPHHSLDKWVSLDHTKITVVDALVV